MLPRPKAWFCPCENELRPVRWHRLAASLLVLLVLVLLMMWLAPSARGADGACQAAAEAVMREHAGRALPKAWRPAGVERVRVLRPGDAMTMDLDPGRLTLRLDAAGRVASAACE